MFTSCCSAGIWPIWKAEASVSFFHLLFELLDTVQEGHHGVVEFIVPEEPQATWAVERKLLDKQWDTEKGQDWSLEEMKWWQESWLWGYCMYYLRLVCQGLQVRVVPIRDKTISVERSKNVVNLIFSWIERNRELQLRWFQRTTIMLFFGFLAFLQCFIRVEILMVKRSEESVSDRGRIQSSSTLVKSVCHCCGVWILSKLVDVMIYWICFYTIVFIFGTEIVSIIMLSIAQRLQR